MHAISFCSIVVQFLLPLIFQADLSILDEIDSGLDIDALRDVSTAVNALKREDSATLMVTHYKVGR